MGMEEEDNSTSASEIQEPTKPPTIGGNKMQDEEVQGIISVARSLGAISLDVSKKGLQHIPASLLELDHVEVSLVKGKSSVSRSHFF